VKPRKALRLRHFDYSKSGAYFVTLCASDRLRTGRERFGNIRPAAWDCNSLVFVPNDVGEIVCDCWIDVPGHFSAVMVDEFALLPDHFHAILFIKGTENHLSHGFVDPSWLRVGETHNGTAWVDARTDEREAAFRPDSQLTLSTVIGSFKSATSRISASMRPAGRLWQRGFHDRVVRDQIELDAYRRYIKANVAHHVYGPGMPGPNT
jgi:putative transposase